MNSPAQHRDWVRLAAATLAFSLGFGIYSGLMPTFAAGALHLSRPNLGLLESLREVPGLLTALMIAAAASIAPPRLALLALGVMALGIGFTGQVRSFWPLVACSVWWSVGLHVWLTVQPTLGLALSPAGQHGRTLGMLGRYSALSMVFGLIFVMGTARGLGYGAAFALAGGVIALGCLAAAGIRTGEAVRIEQRLVFRRRYGLYYLLMLLDGGRRVLIQTFVLLILVREFGVGRASLAAIMVVTSALTMLIAPVVGGWTDRFGERRILAVYYLVVVGVFALYTLVRSAPAFAGVYILDNLLFTCAVGIPTYARRLCPPGELSRTLAMGLTMNHVAAVAVPVTAGLLWSALGYRMIFWAGAGLAGTAFLSCFWLPRRAA